MNTNRDILDRWTPSSPNGRFPALISDTKNGQSYRHNEYTAFNDLNYYNSMDTWVKKGNYMRIQSIRVGYKLPENWLKLFHMSSGSISLEGRNLFVVGSDYTNYLDPETMGNVYAQPIPKSVTFSLNLNF